MLFGVRVRCWVKHGLAVCAASLALLISGCYGGAVGVALGTLLFGAADALQLRIQAIDPRIPYQFLIAFPYIVTLIALMAVVGRASWPASSGTPYKREEV